MDFVHKHRISTENLGDQFAVTMADGRTSSTAQTRTVPLNLVLPNLREKVAFTVFPLTKYDVILDSLQTTLLLTFVRMKCRSVMTLLG